MMCCRSDTPCFDCFEPPKLVHLDLSLVQPFWTRHNPTSSMRRSLEKREIVTQRNHIHVAQGLALENPRGRRHSRGSKKWSEAVGVWLGIWPTTLLMRNLPVFLRSNSPSYWLHQRYTSSEEVKGSRVLCILASNSNILEPNTSLQVLKWFLESRLESYILCVRFTFADVYVFILRSLHSLDRG